MKFPNKVNKYKTTFIYQMVEILDALNCEAFPLEIYNRVSKKMNIIDFFESMSVLFILNKIVLQKDGRIKKC